MYNAPPAEPISHGTRAPRYVLVTGFAFREGTRHSATRNTEHETDVVITAVRVDPFFLSMAPGGLL